MNRTKSLVVALSLCALCFAAVPALAQGGPRGGQGGPGGPGGRGGQRMDPVATLTTKLGLSTTQQGKIKAIFDSMRSQMQGLPRDDSSREKRQAIFKSVEPQIMAVLTPAQQKKVTAAGGLRGLMGRGPGGGRGAGLFDRTLGMMKLSATEKSKTSALVAEMRSKFEAMRKGQTGPPSVDQANKMRELSDHYKKAIEAVLTPANKKEFEKISASRPGGGGQGRDPGQPGRS